MKRRRGLDTRRRVVMVIFFCALALPLFAVAGCGKQLARMEDNQIKLQAMVAANARDLATISSQLDTGQGKINESIRTLDGDTQQVAGNVTSVRDEQRQFRDAVAAGHEGLNRRIGNVEDKQRSLQDSVAQVSDVTQRTAADLTSLAREHAALQQTVQANQQEITGSFRAVANGQQRIVTGIGALHEANKELAAGNSSLKEQVAAGQQTVTAQIAGLSTRQQQFQASLDTLGTKSDQTAADLADTRSSLQGTLQASREALTGRIDGLAAGQQNLQTSVSTLDTKADRTTADLADTRSSLQDTLRVSREVLTGQIAASLQNQQALQSEVRDLNDKADKLTTNIGDVSSEQTALHATVRTNHDAVVAAMTGLAGHQETLRNGIEKLDGKADRAADGIASLAAQQQSLYESAKANQDSVVAKLAEVATTTGQTARDVTTLNNGQATLQQSVQAGNAALANRATELAESQQALQNRIDNLGQAAQQVAADVAKITAGQDALHQTFKTHSDKTDQQAASLAGVQEEMRTSLDTLTATAGQTDLDIIAMTTRQDALQAAFQSHKETLGTQMTQLADNQQQMQSSLDTVTATTSQAALDILGMTKWQDAIRAALQSQNETLGTQMTQLTDNQQQMQSSLDTVTATTGQASLDALALNNGQSRLGQAVQAGRQEMADKLADVAQGQQKWSERLDAAQARVATIGESVAALEQRIAKLQELLQTSVQTTTAALGTTSQQRLQFEAKVSQDMQAVIDSLAQLHQTQTSLQEQITQVQKSTQGQADSLRSVIEQMKTSPNATNRVRDEAPAVQDAVGASQAAPAPAEVQVSHAADVAPAPEAPQAAE
ncbi:MAG: hypothetical protein M1376_20325 [Planctomycetes bacterium]|nr:hypothetical protein [Planctomycetota bacterium]